MQSVPEHSAPEVEGEVDPGVQSAERTVRGESEGSLDSGVVEAGDFAGARTTAIWHRDLIEK
jgi:hypothetical protein